MEPVDVRAVQEALQRQGFSPGDIDGIWGRRTMLAVKAFQTANGLKVDGIVGPMTMRALMGAKPAIGMESPVPPGPLVWYEEALKLVGTREDRTARSNPEILEWAQKLDIDYKGDDIPWCGLFVAHCIGSSLPDEELPTFPLRARAWRTFGEACTPRLGAVLVFSREPEGSGNGHVGFYHAEDDKAFHVLGGNQRDAVNVARIERKRLLASRWPRTAATMTSTIVAGDPEKAPLSHGEA
jgi:uncharacterized protein (TIGR02594 family)